MGLDIPWGMLCESPQNVGDYMAPAHALVLTTLFVVISHCLGVLFSRGIICFCRQKGLRHNIVHDAGRTRDLQQTSDRKPLQITANCTPPPRTNGKMQFCRSQIMRVINKGKGFPHRPQQRKGSMPIGADRNNGSVVETDSSPITRRLGGWGGGA